MKAPKKRPAVRTSPPVTPSISETAKHLDSGQPNQLRMELNDKLDGFEAGRFVGGSKRTIYHHRSCVCAGSIINSLLWFEFSTHREAVEAGYKPCKICCA